MWSMKIVISAKPRQKSTALGWRAMSRSAGYSAIVAAYPAESRRRGPTVCAAFGPESARPQTTGGRERAGLRRSEFWVWPAKALRLGAQTPHAPTRVASGALSRERARARRRESPKTDWHWSARDRCGARDWIR